MSETTSITLLVRLREQPGDDVAWKEFVQRYRPYIYAYCLAFPMQPADAEDVTQNVLLRLFEKLPEFHYDPARSFRTWLRTVTHNVLCNFLRERKSDQGSGDSAVVRLLANVEAREGLVRQIETGLEQELLDEAMKRVQQRVPQQQWEAFRLTALEGRLGEEAATELGMLVATVYTSKSKVLKLVREEARHLEEQLEHDGK
jgi:RNA polymerase sigma-70 factor (ECF subfamily)